MLAVPLAEASAKIRTGPPVDDEATSRARSGRVCCRVTLATGEPEPDGDPATCPSTSATTAAPAATR